MSKQDEAGLILKLYELRREDTMRKARGWYFQFSPNSVEDINAAMFSEHSGYLRMVSSYWDMVAALVNHGAISLELFNDTNAEHISVFATMEPFLSDMRSTYGPQFMANLEKLIDATPGGRQRSAMTRERMKEVRARIPASMRVS